MPSVRPVQEERPGQPPPGQPAVWAEEEPSAAHPAHVLPAVPVLLQVLTHLRAHLLCLFSKVGIDKLAFFGSRGLNYIWEGLKKR